MLLAPSSTWAYQVAHGPSLHWPLQWHSKKLLLSTSSQKSWFRRISPLWQWWQPKLSSLTPSLNSIIIERKSWTTWPKPLSNVLPRTTSRPTNGKCANLLSFIPLVCSFWPHGLGPHISTSPQLHTSLQRGLKCSTSTLFCWQCFDEIMGGSAIHQQCNLELTNP